MDLEAHGHNRRSGSRRSEIGNCPRSNLELEVRVSSGIKERILGTVQERKSEIEVQDSLDRSAGRQEDIVNGRRMIEQGVLPIERHARHLIDKNFPPARPDRDPLNPPIKAIRIRSHPRSDHSGQDQPDPGPAATVKGENVGEDPHDPVGQGFCRKNCALFGRIIHFVAPFLSFRLSDDVLEEGDPVDDKKDHHDNQGRD